MKNRKQRVELIVELIKNNCIGSQEELATMLAERGYNVTQATLSRDLKMLKTTKVPTDRGTYMYIMPDTNSLKDKLLASGQIAMNTTYQSGFVSLYFSTDFFKSVFVCSNVLIYISSCASPSATVSGSLSKFLISVYSILNQILLTHSAESTN